MKKYSKSVFLIGIVLLHATPIQSFGSRDIAIVFDELTHYAKDSGHIIINETIRTIGVSLLVAQSYKTCSYVWNNAKTFFSTPPKPYCIKNNELKLQPGMASTNFLPYAIQRILEEATISATGNKFLLFYGHPGTGKTTLAKLFACKKGADYYHIHQKNFDGYDDKAIIQFLTNYIEDISHVTPDNNIAILHLEEFGKQFVASSNQISNAQKNEVIESWKCFLEHAKTYYPRVQIIACSNAGIHAEDQFDTAILQRAHVIEIKGPNETDRINYIQSGCMNHLTKQGQIHAQNQINTTASKRYTQQDINKQLQREFHVTDEMLKEEQNKHNQHIKLLTEKQQTWTLALYLQPWLWSKAWKKNQAAENLRHFGYQTPIVTYDLHLTEEQKTAFIQATKDTKDYRALDAITESARTEKLLQIKRMKERYENKHNSEDSVYKNPNQVYTINPATRTCTVTHQGDYDATTKKYTDKPITITSTYGSITTTDLVRAAQQKQNELIIQERKKALQKHTHRPLRDYANTTSPQEELQSNLAHDIKLELAQELTSTKDLVGLTRKALLDPEFIRKTKAQAFKKFMQEKPEEYVALKAADTAEYEAMCNRDDVSEVSYTKNMPKPSSTNMKRTSPSKSASTRRIIIAPKILNRTDPHTTAKINDDHTQKNHASSICNQSNSTSSTQSSSNSPRSTRSSTLRKKTTSKNSNTEN